VVKTQKGKVDTPIPRLYYAQLKPNISLPFGIWSASAMEYNAGKVQPDVALFT